MKTLVDLARILLRASPLEYFNAAVFVVLYGGALAFSILQRALHGARV